MSEYENRMMQPAVYKAKYITGHIQPMVKIMAKTKKKH